MLTPPPLMPSSVRPPFPLLLLKRAVLIYHMASMALVSTSVHLFFIHLLRWLQSLRLLQRRRCNASVSPFRLRDHHARSVSSTSCIRLIASAANCCLFFRRLPSPLIVGPPQIRDLSSTIRRAR